KYTFAHIDTFALALDGLNHLFVAGRESNTVFELDATTGAIINANFITGLNVPIGLALDDNNHLFVTNAGNNTVGEYNATAGAPINAAFISGQGPNGPGAIVFVPAAVPEPGSFVLAAFGITALAAWGRWRRKAPPATAGLLLSAFATTLAAGEA